MLWREASGCLWLHLMLHACLFMHSSLRPARQTRGPNQNHFNGFSVGANGRSLVPAFGYTRGSHSWRLHKLFSLHIPTSITMQRFTLQLAVNWTPSCTLDVISWNHWTKRTSSLRFRGNPRACLPRLLQVLLLLRAVRGGENKIFSVYV